ncbi:hypothetical protein BC829DRAFT_96602 [Chytridium lagenaria]|nr:hypothetical protein BC829DRAFT_96602 [Chytridium lagenaria]
MDDSELFFGDAPSTGTDPLENWFPSPKEFENCAPANSLDRLLGGRVSGETHLFDSLHTNNNNNTNNTNTPNPFPSYLDAAANFNAFGPFPSVSRNNMNVTHPQQQEQHSSGSNRAQSIIPPLPDFATSLDFASTTPSLPHLSVQERIELIQILQRTIAANAAAANLQTFSDAPLFPTSYEPSPVNFFGTPAVQAPVHTAAPMSNPSKVAAARLPEPPTVTLSAIEPARHGGQGGSHVFAQPVQETSRERGRGRGGGRP